LKHTYKMGLKFLMENKQIQQMWKDLDKTHKQVEKVMKNAQDIKNKHKPS
jgi:hypothetical protein